MATLILSLITEAPAWDKLDARSRDELTKFVPLAARDEADAIRLTAKVDTRRKFSPFTGQITALSLLDCEREREIHYLTLPTETLDSTMRTVSEQGLLDQFWAGLPGYDTLVTYNGWSFSLPFLVHRSAQLGIQASVPLPLPVRQSVREGGLRHIDLLEEMTFRGALRPRPSLYLACQAYGLTLPPLDTDDLTVRTQGLLRSTKELYDAWFFRLQGGREVDIDFT